MKARSCAARFLSVPQGELEAARAFGMSPWKVLRRIWFPRAVRLVLPTLGGEVIAAAQGDASGLHGDRDGALWASSKIRQDTFRIYEPLMLVAAIYMCLTFVITRVFGRIERQVPQKR